jgi:hypothetical protein
MALVRRRDLFVGIRIVVAVVHLGGDVLELDTP